MGEACPVRPDVRVQVTEETAEFKSRIQARRDRVLAHPDIAAKLCQPPLSATAPQFWSGYVPPAYHMGKPNDSPVRKQLLAICNEVAERENEPDGNVPIAPRMITDPQLTKLHICLEECGYFERDDKLAYLTKFTGREIASSQELHLDEAGRLITVLSAIALEAARKEADDPRPESEDMAVPPGDQPGQGGRDGGPVESDPDPGTDVLGGSGDGGGQAGQVAPMGDAAGIRAELGLDPGVSGAAGAADDPPY